MYAETLFYDIHACTHLHILGLVLEFVVYPLTLDGALRSKKLFMFVILCF